MMGAQTRSLCLFSMLLPTDKSEMGDVGHIILYSSMALWEHRIFLSLIDLPSGNRAPSSFSRVLG